MKMDDIIGFQYMIFLKVVAEDSIFLRSRELGIFSFHWCSHIKKVRNYQQDSYFWFRLCTLFNFTLNTR